MTTATPARRSGEIERPCSTCGARPLEPCRRLGEGPPVALRTLHAWRGDPY